MNIKEKNPIIINLINLLSTLSNGERRGQWLSGRAGDCRSQGCRFNPGLPLFLKFLNSNLNNVVL